MQKNTVTLVCFAHCFELIEGYLGGSILAEKYLDIVCKDFNDNDRHAHEKIVE